MKAARQKPLVVKQGPVAVKIYFTRPEGKAPFWQVADYSTGRRVLRTFADKGEALAEAQRIARQIASGQAEAAAMSNAEAASFGRAIQLLRPTGDALEIACARYAAAVAILGTGANLERACAEYAARVQLPDKSVADVVAELLAAKAGKRERTREDLKSRLDKFATAFAVPVKSLTLAQVQQWLDGLPTSARDKINQRAKVVQLLRWAWRRGYILDNFADKLERPDADDGEVEIYTPHEITRLLNAARPAFRVFVALGAFAGLRSSEIQRLEWSAIDLAENRIVLKGKKRGSARRIIPIQPNLAAWLAAVKNRKGHVWPHNDDQTCDEQKRCAAATATEDSPAVAWKHNGLRHSFCSYRLAMLKNDGAVALEAGNSATMIHNRYKQLVTEAQAAEWFAVAPAD
ncbi:MAG: tyrosine-type recombinase/integrase [Limisphaerales bacterium]